MKIWTFKITGRAAVFIWLSLLYSSCIQRKTKSEEKYVKRDEVTLYDDNTGMRSVIEVNSKMKADGSYKVYYANGALKISASYVDGMRDGWENEYDSTGKILSKVHFSKNKQNGKAYWYSKDGVLESSELWVNDKQYGEGFVYFPDKSIKKYYVMDFQGDVFYLINYDNDKIVKEEGLVFSPAIFITGSKEPLEAPRLLKDTVKLSSDLSIGTTVAVPLKRESRLFLTIKGDDNVDAKEMEIENNTAVVVGVFTQKGKFELRFRGEMWLNHKLIKIDTLVKHVVVN